MVPVSAVDGLNEFSVRYVSTGNNPGPGTPFKVVLDRLAPAIGAASVVPTATSTDGSPQAVDVTVPFSEEVVRGSDFSGDWFVSETVNTEEGPAERTTNADSVTSTSTLTRTLRVTLVDPNRFSGVDYHLNSPNGLRYEDRAGNMLGDTLTPVS